jgi:hypothetical protein
MSTRLNQATPGAITLLALWSLPFLWIGISMSMRRALDAGRDRRGSRCSSSFPD